MTTFKSSKELLEEQKRLIEEIERKHGKTVDQLYEEREKRVRDAIELREPDRVPVMMVGGPSRAIVEYEPDVVWGFPWSTPLTTIQAMEPKRMTWPGSSGSYQALEVESMKEDEYDLFLSDPSDFILRYHLPRSFGALAPFAKLPPLRNWAGGVPTALLATPEFQQVFETIFKAGREVLEWRKANSGFTPSLEALGFPPWSQGGASAPFDQLTNTYRGVRGVMIDIYRRPEKVLAACEMLASWQIESIAGGMPYSRGMTDAGGTFRGKVSQRRSVLPLTRGGEAFMSVKQFKTFYWPTLKKVLMAIIESGAVPIPFFEECHTSRLEIFLELPKGKAVCHFQHYTDMAKAKEVLGGHLCIVGSIPPSLMQVGSAQEVEDYCRNLIKVAGKGGGFILSRGEAYMPKPENIRALIDSAKKYGTY